ncbi:hypothetical protein EDD90_2787 [Streptomyces sp. Ag109_O5-1]|uniref:hypothetical protein n=1 Tax=Streptomyces sp. Ag109_O5-1 TaxID=1938851 RepID=UPI000F4EBCE5|nr:hypothetical protein [Streptomyces sp. Ag109_O5-1]RPE39769.1 hypothetical protein EDD90_2787 [Streptomyces sp. Ag109_O5-1]
MTTPSNAASRRHDGRAHLTLVIDQEQPTALAEDDEQERARRAAPRPIMVAGSATVRALMALGALLTALGMSFGKAEAVLSHDQPREEADPPEEDALRSFLAATGSDGTTSSNAGYWAPTTRPKTAVSYNVLPAAPTGRHRKSAAAEGWGEWNPDTWPEKKPAGRHRKPHPNKHHHPHHGVKVGKTVSKTATTVALAGAAPGKLSVTPGRLAATVPGGPDLTPGRE